MREVAIIGGGAGGLVAALAAARGGAHVTVYEQKDSEGKSILVSGNGRCNLSNRDITASCYRNAAFVERTLEALPPARVHAFFEDLGLVMVDGGQGRLYPATNKAQTVLRVLQVALAERSVRIVRRRMVKRVLATGDGSSKGRTAAHRRLSVELMDGTRTPYDAVVVAAGGLTPAQLVSAELPYTRPEGRLCALKTDLASAEGLDKVRVQAGITLYDGAIGRVRAVERGEAQFRSFGVSGIAAFNLSRFAQTGDVLCIDLVPTRTREQLQIMLNHLAADHPWRAAIDTLAGLALEPVAKAVLRQASCRTDKPLSVDGALAVVDALKTYRMTVRALDSRHAQVQRGGFAVDAFESATLEARSLPGVHVIGEALDVDGPCGGFNLHWAWTTGLLAGAHAAGAPIDRVLAR